jgi:hypothetical protein
MFLEHFPLLNILTCFSVFFLRWALVQNLRYRARIAKLGCTPPTVPYRFPFGIDTLYKIIKYNNRNANIPMVFDYIAQTGAATFQVSSRDEETN